MITVEKALEILKSETAPLAGEWRSLGESNGHVLAESILSPIDMPSFDQSAMDGYAINAVEGRKIYNVISEVAAGSGEEPVLNFGEAVRIFTGAMVPASANVVVQQEWVVRAGNEIRIEREIQLGQHIRRQGEQIKTGELALQAGAILNPAAIGFLAGLGITEVNVLKRPKIGLITTGNELVEPGNELKRGQIYESNSAMLCAAFETYYFKNYTISKVEDDYDLTKKRIETELDNSDFVILTGGISVGDYDFVGKALQEIGTQELFYKINQKPGKPLYFGRIGNKMVAALPGNPAAALTCFYRYVLPVLNQMAGKGFFGLEEFDLPLAASYFKKGERAEFLKAAIKNGTVSILGSQSSAMLNSYAQANALIYIPAEKGQINKDECVKVLKF
jgi:molybdopterin molybdotransferase